jgi:hypothetical protein
MSILKRLFGTRKTILFVDADAVDHKALLEHAGDDYIVVPVQPTGHVSVNEVVTVVR